VAADNGVRAARTQEALSMARLAQLAGIDEKTLRRVEEGRRNVSPNTKAKIVKAFNMLPDKQQQYTFDLLFPENSSEPTS
jgi:transcriptional regulator with XRE-family HTH domain